MLSLWLPFDMPISMPERLDGSNFEIFIEYIRGESLSTGCRSPFLIKQGDLLVRSGWAMDSSNPVQMSMVSS